MVFHGADEPGAQPAITQGCAASARAASVRLDDREASGCAERAARCPARASGRARQRRPDRRPVRRPVASPQRSGHPSALDAARSRARAAQRGRSKRLEDHRRRTGRAPATPWPRPQPAPHRRRTPRPHAPALTAARDGIVRTRRRKSWTRRPMAPLIPSSLASSVIGGAERDRPLGGGDQATQLGACEARGRGVLRNRATLDGEERRLRERSSRDGVAVDTGTAESLRC